MMMVIVVVMAVVTLTVTSPRCAPWAGKDTSVGAPLGGAAGNGGTNQVPLNLGGGGEASSYGDKDEEEIGAEVGAVKPLPAPSPGPEMKFVD